MRFRILNDPGTPEFISIKSRPIFVRVCTNNEENAISAAKTITMFTRILNRILLTLNTQPRVEFTKMILYLSGNHYRCAFFSKN